MHAAGYVMQWPTYAKVDLERSLARPASGRVCACIAMFD
jgi:hypothetical protein